MKNLATLMGIVALLLCACSKEDKEVTISGRIITDCNGTPVANTTLTIFQDQDYFSVNDENTGVYSATTDAEGNFSFKVFEGYWIKIRIGSSTIITSIPTKKDLNLGTFYVTPTTAFVHRIKVNNSYQEGDTLHYSIYHGTNSIILPAPLSDTTFLLVQNYNQLATQTYENTDIVSIEGLVVVTKGELNREDIIIREEFTFDLPTCPTTIDTLTIEIN